MLGPDKSFPGPGTYKEKGGIGKESTKYTIRSKTSTTFPNKIANRYRKGLPGPGSYDAVDGMKGNGKYVASQFKGSGSSAMKSTATRWIRTERDKLVSLIPGPGKYEVPHEIGKCVNSSISKFESTRSQKFAKTKRVRSINILKSKPCA